ncbi:MAG: FkbM family methyltransferase [Dokdonella sp.]
MKDLLRQLVPPLFFDSIKRARNLRPRYYGLDDIDRKLEKHLPHRDGFFVELGAADGINQSNTLYFERYKGWKGVLVEPTPHNYLLCRRNRSRETKIFCNACTSFDYPEKFVPVVYSNLMTTPVGLESDIPEPLSHAESGKNLLEAEEDVFMFGAVARPLNTILVESSAPKLIDFLSLDVEGAEIEVLKGIDHETFRFKYMVIENRSKDKLVPFMESIGYELVDQISGRDFLFASSVVRK